jgi:phage minor structural protein
MTPVLYEATEKAFTTQGVGALAEATSCVVTEQRNGLYELEMQYPVNGSLIDELTVGRYVLAKPSETGNPQPFRIYKISKPISGTVTVNAEHISYLLDSIPVRPFSAAGVNAALNGLVTNSMIDNPFTVWTDIDNDTSTYALTIPQSFRSCLGGADQSILSTYASRGTCEYEFDMWTVKAHSRRGSDKGIRIEYGKNLIDLRQEVSIASVYTGVLAYWRNTSPEAEVIGDIQYIDGHENYPHERIFILDASSDFQDEPTAEELNSRAQKYISDNAVGIPKVNLSIKFQQLWQTEEYKQLAALERVGLCDYVTVYYKQLGVNAKAEVIKTTYDTLLERYNQLDLGDAKSSMASTIRQTVSGDIKQSADETRSSYQQAIDHSTDLITGGLGGHVIINTNADGQPNEILIMDTADKNTAVNVIRMNEAGIAFSSSGYNGPFSTAWTIDSTFIADYIRAGTLTANLLKAGIIMDAKGYSWWNLETGELHIGSADGGAGVDSLWSQIQANTANITNLQSGVTIGTDTVTIGRNDSNIRSVFGNSALLFVDTSGNRIVWLSTDDGLGAGSLSIGSETNSAQRWRIVPWGDGNTHLKIFKHN